jgi:hypothetical protein
MRKFIIIGLLSVVLAGHALAQPAGWEQWNNQQINEWNRTHPNERLPHNTRGLPPVALQPPKQPMDFIDPNPRPSVVNPCLSQGGQHVPGCR